MFINIPDIPCPVERQVIIFCGKKLVKPKKPLLQKASTKPRIKIIPPVIIKPIKLSFSKNITIKGNNTKEIIEPIIPIISSVLYDIICFFQINNN